MISPKGSLARGPPGRAIFPECPGVPPIWPGSRTLFYWGVKVAGPRLSVSWTMILSWLSKSATNHGCREWCPSFVMNEPCCWA